ncbi:LPXTG cell wall anchor domain-containing protein [Enterococcus faecalis]
MGPQTNEQVESLFSIIGVVLVSMTLLSRFWLKHKKSS